MLYISCCISITRGKFSLQFQPIHHCLGIGNENLLTSQNRMKSPLCRYILGVLPHTTAWDQHWEGFCLWQPSVWVSGTLNMWFKNLVLMPRLCPGVSGLTGYLELWTSGFEIDETQIRLWTDGPGTKRTNRRECWNSYVDVSRGEKFSSRFPLVCAETYKAGTFSYNEKRDKRTLFLKWFFKKESIDASGLRLHMQANNNQIFCLAPRCHLGSARRRQ